MLKPKRSECGRWGTIGYLAVCALVTGAAGCGGFGVSDVVPPMDELIDPNQLKYETQDLTPTALEERMREIGKYYAEPRFSEIVQASYATSLKSISERNGYDALWRGARACAWIAQDEKESPAKRREFALKGMAMGRKAIEKASTKVESYYYYSQCLGALCDMRRDASRDDLHEMRDQMKVALALDEKFDYCGPHRFLGQLFIDTDPYPTYAVGTAEEGLAHLERAVSLCPDYGENHLVYAQALKDEGQMDLARAEVEKVMSSPKPRDRLAEHDAWLEKATVLLTELQGK